MQGLVMKSTGSWYRVLGGDGVRRDCRLRGIHRLVRGAQTNPVAVGDYVRFTLESDGTGLIIAVEERRNCIVRKAASLSRLTQVLAANVDVLCIVASLPPPRTGTGFIDRLLVTAEAHGVPSSLLFNKCDLHDASLLHEERRLRRIYRAAGYPVHVVSALRGDGLDRLRALVSGRTVLFCGHSGVGKSALLNALDSSLCLRVGAVSRRSGQGRHTTTCAELLPFCGGYLIDTPGVKEFGMADVSPRDLPHLFPEMRALLPRCRFSDCTHRREPGCAVRAAVSQGIVSGERYHNYLGIMESLGCGDVFV